jgi:arylsulfatase A-like enzyme
MRNPGTGAASEKAADRFTRRRFLAMAGAGAATLAVPRFSWAQEQRKPNILLIFSDDQGYADMGCQGCQDIPTPHLDSLAANGVRFTDGYVTAPLCSPSRAGLLTGRYQQRFGHEHNPGNSREAGLPRTETTLANRLKAVGYATGMVGKWHLGMLDEQNPVNRGFDEFYGFLHGAHSYLRPNERSGIGDPIRRGLEPVEEPEYLTDGFAREGVAFIERHKAEPFFLYLAFNAVHSPLEASAKYSDRFQHIADPKRRTYAGMLSAMDDAVGALLAKLQDAGIEDDTLIFFISDNGGPTSQTTSRNDPLRGFKGQVYEGGIRVPFLVQWKGRLPRGMVYAQPVSSLDVVPTALAAAGAEQSAEMKLDGVNLAPFVGAGNAGEPHAQLFWRMGPRRAMRRGPWKLVDNAAGAFELYNLAEDIAEQRNLAQDKADVYQQLMGAYADWDAQNVEALWLRESFAREGAARGTGAGTNLQRRFQQLDADGDGKLSADELGQPQLHRRLDADGDGLVTPEEARSGFANRQGR